MSEENDQAKRKLNPKQCGESTFRLLKSVNDLSQMTDAVLNIADPEPEPQVFDKEKEDLLRDVLYSVDCLMGKSKSWSVATSNAKIGITCQNEKHIITTVTLEEVTQVLEEAFSTNQETIQRLREEAKQREPAKFQLSLTVVEAEIHRPHDIKGLPNSYIRMKVGPKFFEEHETPQLKGTRFPKWKHDMDITIHNILDDYLLIELWHEEEVVRKKRHLIPIHHSHEPTIKLVLLANLILPIKDALESGITGWYKLQSLGDSDKDEVTRVHLSGKMSCVSEMNEKSQDVYDKLLKYLMDHVIMKHSEDTVQSDTNCDSWRENVPASVIAIIEQFALVLNLSQPSQLLSWWNVVTNMSSYTDWNLVLTQFNDIKVALVKGFYSYEQQQYLSSSLSEIMNNCIKNIKHLERCFPVAHGDRSKTQLTAMLQIIKSMRDNPRIKVLLGESTHLILQNVPRLGLQSFARYWWNKVAELLKLTSKKKEDHLRIILTITKEVYNLLLNASGFYEKIFSIECDMCCLKIVYQELIEEMLAAIEPVIKSCCQAIPASEQLIGDEGIECDFLKGSYLMKIYKNLFRIARVRCTHLSQTLVSETGIEEFYKLFEIGFRHQLALTTDREFTLIREITAKDTLEPINTQDHFSASLLEATAIAHRVKVWWIELSCPNVEDRVINMKMVLSKLIYLARTYCEMIYKKFEVIFEGCDETSREIVNKKVCVAMINMDLMMKEITKFPDILGYTLVENRVKEDHTREINGMIENETKNVEAFLSTFIIAVIDRRKDFLEKMIIRSCEEEGATDFLKDVLHPTIDLLLKMLELSTVQKVLECLWDTIVKIMRNIITNDPQRNPLFYGKLHKLIKRILSDFTPESGEALDMESAETSEYTSLIDDLQIMEKDTIFLMTLYYQERLLEQTDKSSQPSASLVINTWIEGSTKLMVHVLMVKDIVVPPEEQGNAPLDYYIKIQILPDELGQIPINSTQILKEDPATFNQEFEIDIEGKEDSLIAGVMVFVLKDHNRTRSDTFLGEAVVLLTEAAADKSKAENIYLKMTVPVFGERCRKILQVLSSRKSDKHAASFIKLLKKQYCIKSFMKNLKDEKEKDEYSSAKRSEYNKEILEQM